jgi:hypothetical protein
MPSPSPRVGAMMWIVIAWMAAQRGGRFGIRQRLRLVRPSRP